MKLKIFATYRETTGCRELDIPAPSTAMELLKYLSARYGPEMEKKLFENSSEISGEVILLVNGRNIAHLDRENTLLSEGDVVSLFPMVAGG